MRFLPPSTNSAYTGSLLAAHFLSLFSALTIVPGCIHTFAPDGGAGTIAGIDLSQNGRVIIALFAWAGATAPPERFAARSAFAKRSAGWVSRCAPVSTPANVSEPPKG